MLPSHAAKQFSRICRSGEAKSGPSGARQPKAGALGALPVGAKFMSAELARIGCGRSRKLSVLVANISFLGNIEYLEVRCDTVPYSRSVGRQGFALPFRNALIPKKTQKNKHPER